MATPCPMFVGGKEVPSFSSETTPVYNPSHGTVIAEIRSEVTDAEGRPIVTSIVTMLGEAAHHEAETAATVAAIASI